MVKTMAKLCMAHASTHGARKPPGPKKEKEERPKVGNNNGQLRKATPPWVAHASRLGQQFTVTHHVLMSSVCISDYVIYEQSLNFSSSKRPCRDQMITLGEKKCMHANFQKIAAMHESTIFSFLKYSF